MPEAVRHFILVHPAWAGALMILIPVGVIGGLMACFHYAAQAELKDDAERDGFPKDRVLTPEALERFELERQLR